jgi:hypothetical protein
VIDKTSFKIVKALTNMPLLDYGIIVPQKEKLKTSLFSTSQNVRSVWKNNAVENMFWIAPIDAAFDLFVLASPT